MKDKKKKEMPKHKEHEKKTYMRTNVSYSGSSHIRDC